MKFTKTALAVAIAGIAAAPMVATADTTLSGIIEINVNGTDADDDSGDPTVGTGDVFFGIVAEQELNSGLTGYGSLRLDLDGLSNSATENTREVVDADNTGIGTLVSVDRNAPSYDNVYVGMKGGFGDFRLGEIPLAVEYGQVANDIFDVGAEINGGLSYTGTFGPVGLVANFSPENNSDAIGLGAKFGIGGFSIGLGAEERASRQNAAVGASFAYAGAAISAHYWTKEAADPVTVNTGAADREDREGFAVQVGYGFGGVAAKLTVATNESADTNLFEQQAIRLDLGYDLGGGLNASTRITALTNDGTEDGEDVTQWRVQLAKSF